MRCLSYVHPGFYGEKNRVGGLDQHIEDWKRIIG